MTVCPDVATKAHTRAEEEVILMHKGQLSVDIADGSIELGPVTSLPFRSALHVASRTVATTCVEAYVVRGGDHPQAPTLTD